MNAQQIKQREAIMERLWSVEDSAPNPEDPALLSAAESAARSLEALLKTLKRDRDSLNVGKTWRYLGDAYFTRSGKRDEHALRRGREAYLKAETLLADAGNPLEMAKLQFNLANTTRLLDGGRNRSLLEEARRRYNQARKLFAQEMPSAVRQVETSLESLEIVIRGVGFLETSEKGYRKTGDLMERLKAAGGDPDEVRAVQQDFEAIKEKLRPEDVLQRFRTFIDDVSPLLTTYDTSAKSKLGEARSMLDEFASQFGTSAEAAQPSDAAIFGAVFEALKKAGQRGEVSSEREAALCTALKEFQSIWEQPAATPEEMVLKSSQMRAVIARYKNVFMNPEMGGK